MRRFLILAVLLLAAAFAWGQHEKELTGIWINDEEQAIFVFIDNLCFFGDINGGQYEIVNIALTYTFNRNSKILELYYDDEKGEFGASLSGNNLTLTIVEDESMVFTKKTGSPAPAAIAGIWKGPDSWVFAFINDQVFIVDEEGDADAGTFKFSGNKGSFETNRYRWEIDFTVSGNTLTASGGVEGRFTRVR